MALLLLPGCDAASEQTPSPAESKRPAPSTPAAALEGKPASGKCDTSKVHALAEALRVAESSARPGLVLERLPEACQLHASTSMYLSIWKGALDPATPKPEIDRAGIRMALEKICPNAREVIATAIDADPGQAQGIMYDGCDLARFGIVERAAYAELEGIAPLAVHAHQWLLDQGQTAADVEPISGALLQMAHPRTSGRRLPSVPDAVAGIPEGTRVHVTQTQLRLGDQEVAVVRDGALPVMGHLVSPLYDRLDEDKRTGAPLVLYADGRTPFATVRNVTYTAERAGFREVAVVVDNKAQKSGVLRVTLPKPQAGSPPASPIFAVELDPRGFAIKSAADVERIDGASDNPWGTSALVQRARKHLERHPAARLATVTAADDVPWAEVVGAMAALHGHGCEAARDTCIFPDLELAL